MRHPHLRLDTLAGDYENEEDFETAVSVAYSLTLDAIGHAREVALVTCVKRREDGAWDVV